MVKWVGGRCGRIAGNPNQLIVNRPRRRHNQLRSLWANDASFKKQIKLKYAAIRVCECVCKCTRTFFRQIKQSNYGQIRVCRGAATSAGKLKANIAGEKIN